MRGNNQMLEDYTNDFVNKKLAKLIFGRNMCHAVMGGGLVFTCITPHPWMWVGAAFMIVGALVNSYFVHASVEFLDLINLEELDLEDYPEISKEDQELNDLEELEALEALEEPAKNNEDLYSQYNGITPAQDYNADADLQLNGFSKKRR